MQPIKIPQYVDDPTMVLFWAADEVAPFFAAAGIGMVFEQMLYSFLICLAYVRFQRKFKGARLRGFGGHMLWYHGILPVTPCRTIPDPYAREFYS